MPDATSSLASKAFGDRTDPALVVAHESYREALRFLSETLGAGAAVALVQGPAGAGKSTLARAFRERQAGASAVALLDGTRLSPHALLDELISQYAISPRPATEGESLQRLNAFLIEEARSGRTPLLIVDNVDRATLSALRMLDWLACLEVGSDAVLSMVLTSHENLQQLMQQDSVKGLARRRPVVYSLNPLSLDDASAYLRTRYIAAGGNNSEAVFPADVCRQLQINSGGWPGALNERAIRAVRRIAALDTSRPGPSVIVTRDGDTLARHELQEGKYIIGRAELADISLPDPYISKTHALLQVFANGLLLQDLNSTNGTTVNSRVIYKTILRNDDIISLGSFRLKVANIPALPAEIEQRIDFTDTLTAESLDELRRKRGRRLALSRAHR